MSKIIEYIKELAIVNYVAGYRIYYGKLSFPESISTSEITHENPLKYIMVSS